MVVRSDLIVIIVIIVKESNQNCTLAEDSQLCL